MDLIEILILCAASILTSALTFFSGFGLGTLLTPVFAIFFDIEVAIALTAIVHFMNNVFKLSFLGKSADREIVLRFGLPALAAALLGAFVLTRMTFLEPVATYSLFGREHEILPVKLFIAVLLLVFVALELAPKAAIAPSAKHSLLLGGLLSGFFGGLSGHQGALRTAYLVKAGLSKEAFIATGVVIACMVDISRLGVYFTQFVSVGLSDHWVTLTAATLSAFAGAYIGNRLLRKVTMRFVQVFVVIMIAVLSLALGAGLI